MSALSLSGLVSGFDTTGIVDQLVRFGQQRIDQLESRRATAVQKLNTFSEIETRLLELRSQSRRLGRFHNGAFVGHTATSSDETIVKAAAGSAASPGTHILRVNQLATQHQLASHGFAASDSEVTQGTFQISSGDKSATITVDSSNNNLTAFAQAINNANAGVQASIINDSSDTNPYRLLLSADDTGTENAITITNSLAADSGSAVKPVFQSSYVGAAVAGDDYTGTSTVSSNSGAGNYNGTSNDTFTFTIDNSGTVGTDSVNISYTNSSGSISDTITVSSVDTAVDVIDGIQIQLSAGNVNAGETFTVDAFVPTVQAASDAQIQIGSGSGAILVEKSSNLVTGVIAGVTLDLQSADSSQEVKLTIENDVSTAKEAILDYVEDINDLLTFVGDNSEFDSETGQAGLLFGERRILSTVQLVRTTLTAVSDTLPASINRLASIGISFRNGQAQVDEEQLDDFLNGRIEGVDFSDIQALFGVHGDTDNANVRFNFAGNDAAEGEVQVDITQAAERATITSSTISASTTIQTGVNDTFTLDIDGTTSGTITLNAGTYSRTQLAAEVETRINADETLAFRNVNVRVASESLVIETREIGSFTSIGSLSGTSISDLGFTGSETDTGQDVAGSFIVDGETETATGSGQFLLGDSGNASTDGLQMFVTLDSSQVVSGVDATVDFTRGIASKVQVLLDNLLDIENGRFTTIEDNYKQAIEQRDEDIERATDALEQQRNQLLLQFARVENALNNANSTSASLTSQFSSLLSKK